MGCRKSLRGWGRRLVEKRHRLTEVIIHRPAAASAAPPILPNHCPPGATFSTRMKAAMAAIHNRFITPAAKRKHQQQPAASQAEEAVINPRAERAQRAFAPVTEQETQRGPAML